MGLSEARSTNMRRLKADLHTHTADDPNDAISYSTEMLIDRVAEEGFDVLAVTCHDDVVFTDSLREYAERRNIILIPGVERNIEGKHVVLLNPDEEQASVSSFSELRTLGRRDCAVLAPHPFYPTPRSLWGKLAANIDVFDAIEYCSLYSWGVNPNYLAARAARRHGLPMAGTSDSHQFPYRATTFSWVEAVPTVAGVIEAIRAGRIWAESRPRPALLTAQQVFYAARGMLQDVVGL